MATKLTEIDVDEISLVGKGANQRTFTLLKSATKEADQHEHTEDVVDINELTKAVGELDDAGKDELKKALGIEQPKEETPEEFKARVLKAITEAKGDEDELLKGADDKTVEVVKVLRDEIRKAREDAEQAKKDAAEQKEELKKAREAEKDREFLAKAQGLDKLPGNKPEEFGTILKRAYSALTDDERKKLDEVLKAANELADNALFRETGTDYTEGSAEAEVQAKAEELMKSDSKLTIEQAKTEIAKRFPELFNRATEEEAERRKKSRE